MVVDQGLGIWSMIFIISTLVISLYGIAVLECKLKDVSLLVIGKLLNKFQKPHGHATLAKLGCLASVLN